MNLAVIGFILIFVLMFVLIKDRLSPPVTLMLLPLIAAVASGFGIEAISGFVKTDLNTILSTAILFIFSISYSTLISNKGLFDPIIHFLIKRMGNNITTVLFAVAIATFVAHLDSSGATTFLIVVPASLPVYKRLRVRPEALLGTICSMYGVVNIIPWGGPTMHAASVIGIEVSDSYQSIMPSVMALAVIASGIAFMVARIGIHSGAGADRGDTATDEKGAGEGTTKRKKLYWFNLGLTVPILALLFMDIGLPLRLTFMIAFCTTLAVNYPNTAEQTKQLKSYAASAMIMTMALFSVGISMGMIKDPGMVGTMAAAIVGVLPTGVAPHMHQFIALFAVPLVTILGTDTFYHVLMPIILGVTKQFRISPEVVTTTFPLTATLDTSISPSVATVYVGLGLAGSTIDEHIKYSLCILWPTSILLPVVSTLIDVIRF